MNHQIESFGTIIDNIFIPNPESAAIASLSLKLSETILAATFINTNTNENLMRFDTVGTFPPTRNMTAEYVIIKKKVSVMPAEHIQLD